MAKKVSDEKLASVVASSTSIRQVLSKLGKKQAGGTHYHYKKRIDRLELDTSHFKGKGWNKGGTATTRKTAEEILILRKGKHLGRTKAQQLRRALLEIRRPYVCERCKNPGIWLSEPLTLQVDHINNDWTDDRAENLRFLCPNCHWIRKNE